MDKKSRFRVGYTVIASAPNVGTMAGGIILYAMYIVFFL